MSLFADTMAYGAGFAALAVFGPTVGQTKLDSLPKALLLSSPSATGSVMRLHLGGNIDRNGGKKVFFAYLALANLGMLIMTILAFTTDIKAMTHKEAPYYVWVFSGLLAGFGVASFAMIINVLYWSTAEKKGTN